MIVLTISNQKGGIGKTTTALCLGAELEAKGYKVLYVDLDAQNDASRTLNADLKQKGSYDILANKTPAKDVIQVTESGQHVIAASEKLVSITAILNEPKNQLGKEYRLKESLDSVKNDYDFVLIDTARELSPATVNALTCTDYLIISAMADDYSLTGTEALLSITDVIKQYTNKELKTAGILITKYGDRSNISRVYKDELSKLAEQYGTKVFNTCIRENVKIAESQALRIPITKYAPKSNGNIDYLAFTEELLEQIKG